MKKPLSIANRDYLQSLCDITNNCGLPAFVVVDTLTKLLNQMQIEAENELKRDEVLWRKSLIEGVKDGGQKDESIPDANSN